MPFKIERSEFDPEDGFLYYVSFKPHLQLSTDEIKTRMPVEAAISVSETGELALVQANPNEYHELASIQALSDANVTWNNPAFAPPYLLVRNGQEAVCYRLPLRNNTPATREK